MLLFVCGEEGCMYMCVRMANMLATPIYGEAVSSCQDFSNQLRPGYGELIGCPLVLVVVVPLWQGFQVFHSSNTHGLVYRICSSPICRVEKETREERYDSPNFMTRQNKHKPEDIYSNTYTNTYNNKINMNPDLAPLPHIAFCFTKT